MNTPRRSPVRFHFRVLSIFHLISTASVAAAFAGPVNGRVVDPDNRPVPSAHVLLVAAGAPIRTAETNGRGEFSLVAPDSGRYELRVAVDGFRAEPVIYEASATARDVGSIELAVSAVSETLVVSASQVEIPRTQASSAVSVLPASELRDRQLTTIADALRQVPGLTVARSGSMGAVTSIFPRGGESDYTLVYVDGIQVNAFGGGFDFAHLSTANIDRVEIVRGPQSALYGSNAIGSVVRVVTREGGSPSADASFEGGSFGTMRMTAATAGTAKHWSWGGGVDRLVSDGFNGQQTAAGEHIGNDRYERTEVAGSTGWRTTQGTSLRGEVRFARDDRGFPGPFGSNPLGVYGGVDLISHGTDDRWGGSLGAVIPSGPRVRTSAQVAWSRDDGHFASSFGPSQSASRRATGRVQTDFTVAHGVDVSAGVEFLGERATSTYITDDQGKRQSIDRFRDTSVKGGGTPPRASSSPPACGSTTSRATQSVR